jgi:hypothetical protein
MPRKSDAPRLSDIIMDELADGQPWDQLSDRELLGEAARELLIITILASRALQNQISSLMRPQKFLELTNLIKALSVCFKTVCEVWLQVMKMPASSTPPRAAAGAL